LADTVIPLVDGNTGSFYKRKVFEIMLIWEQLITLKDMKVAKKIQGS